MFDGYCLLPSFQSILLFYKYTHLGVPIMYSSSFSTLTLTLTLTAAAMTAKKKMSFQLEMSTVYSVSFSILCIIPLVATTKVFSSPIIHTTLLLLLFPAFLLLRRLFFFFQLMSRTTKDDDRVTSLPLPPGPTPLPFIGNLHQLYTNKPKFRWISQIMKSMNTKIACIRVGSVHIILVKCPQIAREFLVKQDAIFASRPLTMATEYTSHGFKSVVTAPWGNQWKKMRRVTAELFNPARMRWLHDKRAEEADNLVFYLNNQCKQQLGGTLNLRLATRAYCGNVIRKLIFNKRYFGEATHDGGPSPAEEEHVEALFTGLSFAYSFCISDYIPSLRWFDLEGHEKIMKATTATIEKYHKPIVENRIQQWEDAKKNGLSDYKKEPEDLLDILISLEDDKKNRCLSTEEIKGLVSELVYAAVDNPSNAVEWALAEMINQPEVLRKAVDEIDNVVGKDRLVQESDIPKLNYVKACAREAFRLHPMAPFNLPHVSMADTTVAGYFIPKGSHVLLSRLELGRNPKVWEDPLKFKPERHLKTSNGSTTSSVELNETELRFISFSAGRRGCMAVPLGSAMTTMLLARLLQGFHWTVPHGESKIDLCESSNDLTLAKPLHAHATPRLPSHVYPTN